MIPNVHPGLVSTMLRAGYERARRYGMARFGGERESYCISIFLNRIRTRAPSSPSR